MEQQTELIFNHILVNYKQRFLRFAQSYVHDKETAEDLVMDSLLYYWENKDSLEAVENVPMYLLTVLKHKCLNHLQRQCTWEQVSGKILSDREWDVQMRITSLEACDPERIFSDEIQQLFHKALATLPEKTQQIFLMSRSDGKSYKEIAEAMNLTTKSIEFHVSKALNVLRIVLKDYLPVLLPAFEFFYL